MSESALRNRLLDSPERYGLVSRILHWVMAYLILWQFGMMLAYRIFGPLEIIKTISAFGPYHATVGLLTFILVVLRGIWTLANRGRRPHHAPGLLGYAVLLGHMALYLLLFAVPVVALLRIYGGGKGWRPWGLPIVPETGEEVQWMLTLGNAAHGLLAWSLACLAAGHILMALIHGLLLRDGILARMAGPIFRKRNSLPRDSAGMSTAGHGGNGQGSGELRASTGLGLDQSP